MRTEFVKDALIWAELGMAAFAACFTVIVLEAAQAMLFLSWHGAAIYTSMWLSWLSFILLSLVPLFLAILTYTKIMQPLKANVAPSKAWASALETAGYIFGFFVGGILLWTANKKVKIAQDQDGNSKPA